MLVILKLKLNEYVMGRMLITDEKSIELEDALTIGYYFSESGYPTLYFSKYCMFTKGCTVSFANEDIMHVFKDPTDEVVDFYQKHADKIFRPKRTSRRTRRDELLTALAERLVDDKELH